LVVGGLYSESAQQRGAEPWREGKKERAEERERESRRRDLGRKGRERGRRRENVCVCVCVRAGGGGEQKERARARVRENVLVQHPLAPMSSAHPPLTLLHPPHPAWTGSTCIPGVYGDPSQHVACQACGPHTSSTRGANRHWGDCFCIKGFYGVAASSAGCRSCPGNSTTRAAVARNTSLSDCQCNAGYYGNPGGMTGGSLACTPCPSNTYNNQTGARYSQSTLFCSRHPVGRV